MGGLVLGLLSPGADAMVMVQNTDLLKTPKADPLEVWTRYQIYFEEVRVFGPALPR